MNRLPANKSPSEIIIYQTEDGQTTINVRLEDESVWLTQMSMTELFQTSKQNISLHLRNIFIRLTGTRGFPKRYTYSRCAG